MPYTAYVPDTKQWTDYFVKQVGGLNGGYKKKSGKSFPIGGGISVYDEGVSLTSVGKVKIPKQRPHSEVHGVKIEMTSPVETTLEQAESELKNIKKEDKATPGISRKATKRKAPTGLRSTGRKRAKTVRKRKYNDVFARK